MNNIYSAFLVSRGSYQIRMGYENQYFVRPVELSSHEDLRAMPIPARKCRFLDEMLDGSQYNFYTQDLCLFQCKTKMAFETCGCVPWNFLHWEGTENKTCDRIGSSCFEWALWTRKDKETNSCDCLPDCNSVEMTISQRQLPLAPEELCNKKSHLYSYLQRTMASRFNKFVEAYNLFTKGLLIGEGPFAEGSLIRKRNAYCKTLIQKDIARVKVTWESGRFARYRQNVKVSMTERIANFGEIQFSVKE